MHWAGPSRSGGAALDQLAAEQHWLVNTLLYAGVGALGATALASAAGYALAKYEFRGRQLVFSVILGGVLVPGTALLSLQHFWKSGLAAGSVHQ